MPNNRLRSAVFAMSFLSSDDRVRRETRSFFSGKKQAELPFVSPVRTRLTAVSFRPQSFRRLRDAVAAFQLPLEEAAAQGSPLAAFPELTGLSLLGLLPQCERVFAALREDFSVPADRAASFAEAVQITQGYLGEVFFNLFSELARGRRMLLAVGGFYVREEGQIRNRQYLFSEDGELLGRQDKLILSPFERECGVTAAQTLTPMETRVGRLALLTGSCGLHYEPFAVASALGCRIAVAGASPFYEDLSLLAARSEESGLTILCPGIEASGLFLLPRSISPAVYLPRHARRAQGEHAAGKGNHSVTARVDLSAPPAPDHYSADSSPAFFRSYLREKSADADEVLEQLLQKNSEKK